MISLINTTNNKHESLKRFYNFLRLPVFYNFLNPKLNKLHGPGQRFRNLQKGLNLIGQEIRVNPSVKDLTCYVHVLSDVSALRLAIKLKRAGRIKVIMAGPTVVSCPPEYNGLINDPNIDIVLTASEWVTKMFVHFSPDLKEKIRVCAGGVDTVYWDEQEEKDIDFLIYNKSDASTWPSSAHLPPRQMELDIFAELLKRLTGYKVATINYGQYKPEEYRSLLQRSRFAVFLSRQETQGHALSEAWSCDVPTLVWNREYWTYKDYRFDQSSSAPYLTNETGMFFSDASDFDDVLLEFLQKYKNMEFSPRKFILRHFSLEKTTTAYMNIWNEFVANKNL